MGVIEKIIDFKFLIAKMTSTSMLGLRRMNSIRSSCFAKATEDKRLIPPTFNTSVDTELLISNL